MHFGQGAAKLFPRLNNGNTNGPKVSYKQNAKYIERPKKCIHNLIEVFYGHKHKAEPKCMVCSVIFSQKMVLVT
jgi:hypothetical protein